MGWGWSRDGKEWLKICGVETAGIYLPDFRNSSGHRLYFGNILFFFSPFKALAECLTTSYLRTVLGVERVPSQYDLPHTEERLLGPYCVGVGAEGCPAKKQKLDRACILPNFSRHALVHCSLFSPAYSSV